MFVDFFCLFGVVIPATVPAPAFVGLPCWRILVFVRCLLDLFIGRCRSHCWSSCCCCLMWVSSWLCCGWFWLCMFFVDCVVCMFGAFVLYIMLVLFGEVG